MPHRVQSPKRSRGATIGLVIAILLGVAILLLNVFTYVLHILSLIHISEPTRP